MDGVIVDFEKLGRKLNLPPSELKLKMGTYRHLDFMDDALFHIDKVINFVEKDVGGRVMIATKIPHDNSLSATEKLEWVKQYLPRLHKKVIITPDKGNLGDERDVLVDDRPHKANVEGFKGFLFVYGNTNQPSRTDRIHTVKNWNDLYLSLKNGYEKELLF